MVKKKNYQNLVEKGSKTFYPNKSRFLICLDQRLSKRNIELMLENLLTNYRL